MRARILSAVLVAMALALAPAASAREEGQGPAIAHASGFRACRNLLLYPPENGGYALIIERMHVQRVSCRRAVRIGGAFIAGEGVPGGWSCAQRFPWTACRYRRSLHRFRFVFGGDAGRLAFAGGA